MLDLLHELLSPHIGAARLFEAFSFRISFGFTFAAFLSFYFLPKLAHKVTQDKGRAHAHDASLSVGKPVGVGIFMILFAILSIVMVTPIEMKVYLAMLVILGASIIGYIDDVKKGGLSELTLGMCDYLLSVAICAILLYGNQHALWLPFSKESFEISYWMGLIIYTPVVWLAINALNCNDGVDGLSGSLSLITIMTLAALLYFAVGNAINAEYLLLPFVAGGATWAVVASCIAGAILGYLWHNAPPSSMLMGDAGSRPLGLAIGMLVVMVGNPTLIFFIAAIILINGATGLVKLAVIRIFKVNLFKNIRFPLHDHVRVNHEWSRSQVLVRFVILHSLSLGLLMTILLKVR